MSAMPRRPWIVLLLVLFVAAGVGGPLAGVTSGAQVPTADAEARGRKIIADAVAAMGGAEALTGVKDFSSSGTISLATPMGEMTAETLAEVVFPDKTRQTLELPTGTMVQGFDGTAGWMKMGPQVMDVPPEMLTEMRRGLITAGGIDVLRLAHTGKAQVQALESAEVNGKRTDVVLWKAGDLEMRLYFDADTHLISKLAYRSAVPGSAAPTDVEVVTTDFREVGGLKFPFHALGTQNGQKFLELTATAIKVNSGIAASGFGKPAQ